MQNDENFRWVKQKCIGCEAILVPRYGSFDDIFWQFHQTRRDSPRNTHLEENAKNPCARYYEVGSPRFSEGWYGGHG